MSVVTPDWKEWIALNLVMQNGADGIVSKLVQAGIAQAEAEKAVQEAAEHPYVKAAMSMGRRLKKQEWLLGTYRRLGELSADVTEVQRRSNLSPERFLREYYSTNRPVVITDCLKLWDAMTLWTPGYLKEHFGNLTVAMQGNRESDSLYQLNDNHHRTTIKFAEFVDMVQSVEKSNDFYITANDSQHNGALLQALQPDIQPAIPYLNANAANSNGFFWFGPAGTITAVHHDLTNNFMAQVRGRKQIKLINSSQLPLTYNYRHCYSQADLNQIDYDRFPLLKQASIIEIILHPGEVLFIPIGWWHHVTALDISITMSFTNFIYDNNFAQNYSTYSEI